MIEKGPLGMPPISYAALDLSRDLGGLSLPSTASSPGGLFSFLSPRPGNRFFLKSQIQRVIPLDLRSLMSRQRRWRPQ